MKHLVLKQGSQEWLDARVGKITASRVKDVVAKKKNGEPTQAYHDYAMELAFELITNKPFQKSSNIAMNWGKEYEVVAKSCYQFIEFKEVDDCGIFMHENEYLAATPDGLVYENGLIEIKCPFNSINHIETLLNGMPKEHLWQIQTQLLVTEREYCDFVSFDPRIDSDEKIYIQRIRRDEEIIKIIFESCEKFFQEVLQITDSIKKRAA